jgi:glycolate oxidase iron-sulfur subunit
MQTNFSLAQLANPAVAESEKILRACVHCGFCTATCPTFLLLGDELDSPRGRIYLIKDMLEHKKPADETVVKHIDRCLSCLACMTACPSGVNYQHLVDHARSYIEATYQRPLADRLLRATLGFVLPYPKRFRAALAGARLAQPLQALCPSFGRTGRRLDAMIRLARTSGRKSLPPLRKAVIPCQQKAQSRAALLRGCVQQVLRPEINEAAIRLLSRIGVETVLPEGEGCCGALLHHLGEEMAAARQARANIDAWCAEAARNRLDAIVMTASGCGSMIKDYGFLLRNDNAYAQKAAWVSAHGQPIRSP